MPKEQLLSDLGACRAELGLKVHALLVGQSSNPAVDALASEVHIFRSWSAVESRVRA